MPLICLKVQLYLIFALIQFFNLERTFEVEKLDESYDEIELDMLIGLRTFEGITTMPWIFKVESIFHLSEIVRFVTLVFFQSVFAVMSIHWFMKCKQSCSINNGGEVGALIIEQDCFTFH